MIIVDKGNIGVDYTKSVVKLPPMTNRISKMQYRLTEFLSHIWKEVQLEV